jgi:hypothetical protein
MTAVAIGMRTVTLDTVIGEARIVGEGEGDGGCRRGKLGEGGVGGEGWGTRLR